MQIVNGAYSNYASRVSMPLTGVPLQQPQYHYNINTSTGVLRNSTAASVQGDLPNGSMSMTMQHQLNSVASTGVGVAAPPPLRVTDPLVNTHPEFHSTMLQWQSRLQQESQALLSLDKEEERLVTEENALRSKKKELQQQHRQLDSEYEATFQQWAEFCEKEQQLQQPVTDRSADISASEYRLSKGRQLLQEGRARLNALREERELLQYVVGRRNEQLQALTKLETAFAAVDVRRKRALLMAENIFDNEGERIKVLGRSVAVLERDIMKFAPNVITEVQQQQQHNSDSSNNGHPRGSSRHSGIDTTNNSNIIALADPRCSRRVETSEQLKVSVGEWKNRNCKKQHTFRDSLSGVTTMNTDVPVTSRLISAMPDDTHDSVGTNSSTAAVHGNNSATSLNGAKRADSSGLRTININALKTTTTCKGSRGSVAPTSSRSSSTNSNSNMIGYSYGPDIDTISSGRVAYIGRKAVQYLAKKQQSDNTASVSFEHPTNNDEAECVELTSRNGSSSARDDNCPPEARFTAFPKRSTSRSFNSKNNFSQCTTSSRPTSPHTVQFASVVPTVVATAERKRTINSKPLFNSYNNNSSSFRRFEKETTEEDASFCVGLRNEDDVDDDEEDNYGNGDSMVFSLAPPIR